MQKKVHLEKMKLLKEHLMVLVEDDDIDLVINMWQEFVQVDFVLTILDYQVMKIQELLDENIVQKEL
jgi:hypothetical protein